MEEEINLFGHTAFTFWNLFSEERQGWVRRTLKVINKAIEGYLNNSWCDYPWGMKKENQGHLNVDYVLDDVKRWC